MKLNKRQFSFVLNVVIFLLFLVVLFIFRNNILDIISPFVISLVLAYLLNPLVNLLERKKIKRGLATLISFLLVLLIFFIIFMSFVPKLVSDIASLVNNFPVIQNKIIEYVDNFEYKDINIFHININELIDIDNEIKNILQKIGNILSVVATNLINKTAKLFDIVMVPIITFYFLKDKDAFKKKLLHIIPTKLRKKIIVISKEIDKVIGGFLRGQLIVATFVGVLTGIGCGVIGIPYAFTVGLIAGITNIIPYFGPYLGGIMPVIFGLLSSKPIMALWVVIWINVVQQIESNFLSPKIMSKSIGLHPVTVIFSLLLGGSIAGVWGMIIGIPVAGTIKVLLIHARNLVNQIKNAY